MGSHHIRKEKWEDIAHQIDRSTELLGDAQELIEELMEDYSYSAQAEERRDKLAQMHADIDQALKALERAFNNLHDY